MTVFEFAKKLMKDEEFKAGGVPKNERKYIDAVGFEYKVEDGSITECGSDLSDFYVAMYKLLELEKKYKKEV